jgi:hypothetical protein
MPDISQLSDDVRIMIFMVKYVLDRPKCVKLCFFAISLFILNSVLTNVTWINLRILQNLKILQNLQIQRMILS